MKQTYFIIVCIVCFQCLKAQPPIGNRKLTPPNVCAIKIGGNFYINMQHILLYKNTDVLDIKSRNDSIIVNLTIYDNGGRILGVVKNSRIQGNNKNLEVKYSTEEFTITVVQTKQVVCYIKKGFNELLKRCELGLWLDAYMPDSFYFQCTPEKVNKSPLPENLHMEGAVFEGGEAAISID